MTTTGLKIAIIKGRNPQPTTHELFRSCSINSVEISPTSHGLSSGAPLEQKIVFDHDPRYFANVVKDLVVRVYKVDDKGKRKDMTQEVASGHRKLLFGELLADNEANNIGHTDHDEVISNSSAGVHTHTHTHTGSSTTKKHKITSITRQLREDKGTKKKIYDNLLRVRAAVEFAPLAHQKQQLHNQINQTNRQVLLTRIGQSISGYMHERTFEEAYVWALSYVNNNTPEILMEDLYALMNAVKRYMLSQRGKTGRGSTIHEDAEKEWEDLLKEGNQDDRRSSTIWGNGHTTTKKEKKRHLTLTQKLEQVAMAGNKKFEKFIAGEGGGYDSNTFNGKKSNGRKGGRRRAISSGGASSGGASSDGSARVEEKDDSQSLMQVSKGGDDDLEESFEPLQLEHDGVVESKTEQITVIGDTDAPAAAVDTSISGTEVALISTATTTTPLLSESAIVPVPQPPDSSIGMKISSHKRRSGAAAISRRTTKVSTAPTRTKEEALALGLAWGPPKTPGVAHTKDPGQVHKEAVDAAVALEEKLQQKIKGFGSGTPRCNDDFPWKSILNADSEKKAAVPIQINRIQREEKAKEIKEKGISEYSNLPRDFIAGMEKQLDDAYGIFEDKIDYFVHDMERRTKRVAQFKRKFHYLSKKAEEASVVVVQHCSDFQKNQAHQRKRALFVVEDKSFTRPENMRTKLELLQIGKMPEKPIPKRPQSAPALLAEGGIRSSTRGGGGHSVGMSSRTSLISHGSKSSMIDGHTSSHRHLPHRNHNRSGGLETSIILEDDEEENETLNNIESYLAAMRAMNDLALTTAEERFSSLRHPSNHQHSHELLSPSPADAATDPSTVATTQVSTGSTKGKRKGKSLSTSGKDVGWVVGSVLTTDSEVVHPPILVDDKTLSDKKERAIETDTLSPLLGESILAAWGNGEGVSVIGDAITHTNDTTPATRAAVKDGTAPLNHAESSVVLVTNPSSSSSSSSSIAGMTKKKKSVLLASSPSVQSHTPSLSNPPKPAVHIVQGVCRLEMERIRRQMKQRQSTHHLTEIAKHLWFVSFVLKLQETTSHTHQEIPPSCLRFLGIIHRLLTHGFAHHLDVILFYKILEDTIVDPHDYPKPLVHRTIFCVADYVHIGPETFITYLEERKITPCSELLAQVREIKERRERHRIRKEKEKRLSSDHLDEMARMGSKHKKRSYRTDKNKTNSQDKNSSPESIQHGGSSPEGSGVWMVGSPDSPDYSASDSNRNSPTSSGRPSPSTNMFRTRSGRSGSFRDRDSSPEGGDRDSPDTVGSL